MTNDLDTANAPMGSQERLEQIVNCGPADDPQVQAAKRALARRIFRRQVMPAILDLQKKLDNIGGKHHDS